MGNSENVVSLDDRKEIKEGFRKKAVDTAKGITGKPTEALTELGKTIRYGMKKRTDTVIHMYGKAEDKDERDDIRKDELKKSYFLYGLTGLGMCCATVIARTWIKSNSKLS
ncbi:hypothetical protein [Bacillus sp. 1P02SD]|uniref:hypothetical protein n=1 Tax=Bacillus sp. 1P02SD TaxID=3132264 RepID=UPI0039A03EB2